MKLFTVATTGAVGIWIINLNTPVQIPRWDDLTVQTATVKIENHANAGKIQGITNGKGDD